MKRAEGWGVLGEVGEVRVGGRRLARRNRKKWSNCVMEDMNLLGVKDRIPQDRSTDVPTKPS